MGGARSPPTKHHQQKTYVVVLFYSFLFLVCAIVVWLFLWWRRRRRRRRADETVAALKVSEQSNEEDDDEASSPKSQRDEESPETSDEAKSPPRETNKDDAAAPLPKASKHGDSISFRCWFCLCECCSLAGAVCTNCLETLLACWIATMQICCSRREEHIRVYDQSSSRRHKRRLSRDDSDDVDHHAFYVDRPVAEPSHPRHHSMSPTRCRELQNNNYWSTRLSASQLQQNLRMAAAPPPTDMRSLVAQSPHRISARYVDPALDYARYHHDTLPSPRSPIILRDQKSRSPSRWHYEKNGYLPAAYEQRYPAAPDPVRHSSRQRSLPPLPPSYYYSHHRDAMSPRPTSPYCDDRYRPHSYRW